MTPRAGKQFRRSAQAEDLAIRHRHAAGIDVHSREHFVAVATEDVPAGFINADDQLPPGVRKFGTKPGDLLASQGFEVLLVDPRQTKHAPGRPKTDVVDCQWIRRLHSYGLLTGSFRPDDDIIRWRGLQRQREMLIRYAAMHVQHLQKVLEEMNVKLTEVVSDIVGQTGMKIIRDIVRGERDPLKLAKHRHESCKRTEAEIASALYGTWRPELLFA